MRQRSGFFQLAVTGLLITVFTASKTANAELPLLTLDDLFASPSLVGTAPSAPVWSPSSEKFAFAWNDKGLPNRDLWVAFKDGSELQRLRSRSDASVRSIAWMYDEYLLSLRGDGLWFNDSRGYAESLMATVGRDAYNLSVSPTGEWAAFLQGGDLWLMDLDDAAVKKATDIGIPRLSSLGAGRYARPEREIGPGIWSGPTYAWSPDGKTIALHIVDRREMRKVPFPDYLAGETDPNLVRRGYPGDANEIRNVGLLDVDSGEITMLPLEAPDANQVIDFSWSPDGVLLVDTASDTAVDRKLFVVLPGETRLREIWRHSRESRMYTSFASAWHPNGKDVVFLSDREDRYGLYVIDASPSKDLPRPLTEPAYDVLSGPTVVTADNTIFYNGNGVNPYELHVYRVNATDGEPQRVTSLAGRNEGFPSPDGKHVVIRHSNDTSPAELYVVSANGGTEKRVTTSPLPGFLERDWPEASYVSFPSKIDDYTLHARILAPIDLDPDKKYPVLFGPVYSNTARNQWRGVYSLVQHYLVQQGYIVVQVDSRGSNGYGRAFREEFLLGFADEDIDDLESAVDYMETLPYVDPDRIGIWGSSYGGTLSVYSLLMKPGLFQAAVAAASAVDPRFFGTDDVAIVRRPETHPEIFERKALNYAANLEDHLLLIHGMQDHVVPFKTTAVLAEELIKQGKNFDFAFAPGATHSWAREPHYQRYLFGKLVEFFDRHLKETE